MIKKIVAVAKRFISWCLEDVQEEAEQGFKIMYQVPSAPPAPPRSRVSVAPPVLRSVAPAVAPPVNRLQEVRQADKEQAERKKAYEDWKQNIKDLDALRKRIGIAV